MISRASQRAIWAHCFIPKYQINIQTKRTVYHKRSRFHLNNDLFEKEEKTPSAEGIIEHAGCTPFRSWVDLRRDEARRSLFVQVKSLESAGDLSQYCTQNFGPVKGLHYHHNVKSDSFSHFFVVEFEDVLSVGKAMFDGAQHNLSTLKGSVTIPVSSPFMWFSSDVTNSENSALRCGPDLQHEQHLPKRASSWSQRGDPHHPPRESVLKEHIEGNADAIQTKILMPFGDGQLEALESAYNLNLYLLKYNNLDAQMERYYSLLKMTETGTRIRFLACEQIELALTGMFPHAEILPFGSSVNSFGRFDCDLDISVRLGHHHLTGGTYSLRVTEGLLLDWLVFANIQF